MDRLSKLYVFLICLWNVTFFFCDWVRVGGWATWHACSCLQEFFYVHAVNYCGKNSRFITFIIITQRPSGCCVGEREKMGQTDRECVVCARAWERDSCTQFIKHTVDWVPETSCTDRVSLNLKSFAKNSCFFYSLLCHTPAAVCQYCQRHFDVTLRQTCIHPSSHPSHLPVTL